MRSLNPYVAVDDTRGLMFLTVTDPVIKAALIIDNKDKFQKLTDDIIVCRWTDENVVCAVSSGFDHAMIACRFAGEKHPLIEGRFAPMQHQKVSALFAITHKRSYNFSECRTGKTGSLILAMDYIQRHRLMTGGWLIITTVTTLWSVWEASIKATIPNADVVVLNGKSRDKLIGEVHDFYITNYDSIRLSSKAFQEAAESRRIGGCIIDELTHVANSQSQRHKAIYNLVNRYRIPYVIGATGSPGCNPVAVYGMARVVNPRRLPATTKTGWMNLTMMAYGSEPWMKKPRFEAPRIIQETFRPAVRFNKADVIDLPPITEQMRQCAMSPEQKKVYAELEQYAVSQMEQGVTFTAVNGGALLQKLLEVSQGFCNTPDKQSVELAHDDRTTTILEAIEETDRKVVVFCCFKHVVQMRKKEFEEKGLTVGVVDGSVTGTERTKVLLAFQNSDNPRVLIAHPTATAFGVELSAADTLIFDGPPLLGTFVYQQALERLSSAKQKANNINVIKIFSSETEKKCFKLLDKGNKASYIISTLFEEWKK